MAHRSVACIAALHRSRKPPGLGAV